MTRDVYSSADTRSCSRRPEQEEAPEWLILFLPAAMSRPAATAAPVAATKSRLVRRNTCRPARPVETASTRRSPAATASPTPIPTRPRASSNGGNAHASRSLDRLDQLRPRQRAGAPLQRDLRAQAAVPLRSPEGRQPDRLQEDLKERGQADPGEGDRQSLRVPQRQVRLHGG